MLLFSVLGASAQGTVRGTVVDKTTEEAISFATVSVNRHGTTTYVAGATTDVDGKFNIKDIADGKYTIVISYVGYKELKRDFELSPQHRTMSYTLLHMTEEPHTLSEVTVTGQKSAMRLEVDRKTFDVSQLISNSGQAATDVLENIPSVEVDNDGNISLRGNSSVEVWINGKASGLTSDNRILRLAAGWRKHPGRGKHQLQHQLLIATHRCLRKHRISSSQKQRTQRELSGVSRDKPVSALCLAVGEPR